MMLYISAMDHARNLKFSSYVHLPSVNKMFQYKLLILLRMSEFMTCSERFNMFSEGSLSQLWNTVGR